MNSMFPHIEPSSHLLSPASSAHMLDTGSPIVAPLLRFITNNPLKAILYPCILSLIFAFPLLNNIPVLPQDLLLNTIFPPTRNQPSVSWLEDGGAHKLNLVEVKLFNDQSLHMDVVDFQETLLKGIYNDTVVYSPTTYTSIGNFTLLEENSNFTVMKFLVYNSFHDITSILFDNIRIAKEKYPLDLELRFPSLLHAHFSDDGSFSFVRFFFQIILAPLVIWYLAKNFSELSISSKFNIGLASLGQALLVTFSSLSIVSIYGLELLQIPPLVLSICPLFLILKDLRCVSLNVKYGISFQSLCKNILAECLPSSIISHVSLIAISLIELMFSLKSSKLMAQLAIFVIMECIMNFILTNTFLVTICINELIKTNQFDSSPNKGNKVFPYLIAALFSGLQLVSTVSPNVILRNIHSLLYINKRGFVFDLNSYNPFSRTLLSPLIFMNMDGFQYYIPLKEDSKMSIDIFFILEFLIFLVFCISSLCIILKITISDFKTPLLAKYPTDISSSPNKTGSSKHYLNSKDLVDGHVLDIVKLGTSSCPFIVSVAIDHKILVWSPLKNPIPEPTLLPIDSRFLPVTEVSMSDSGSLITVFSRLGHIKCWSRLTMSWIWDIHLDMLENDTPLESFFRRRTQVSNGRRKLASRSAKSKEKPASIINPNADEATNLRPGRSMSLDSNFDNSVNLRKLTLNSDMEFIIVLKNGTMYTINCTNGELEQTTLCSSSLICAKKLVSPRVNDRIVAIKENGELLVSTAVNNKWRSRPVKIDTETYNKGRSLLTPAALSKEFELSKTNNNSKKVDFDLADSSACFDNIVMETVPFVGMIVQAYGSKSQLVDVQTGTVLKEWKIGRFKPTSFKVFHPEPSHCRFCGCASVPSFSVAYTELDTNYLILHTFSIDNRAKNNICLRVERDSRETRCLGFASVTEHQHALSNVEGWCSTDLNMLIGVRKKDTVHDSEIIKYAAINEDEIESTGIELNGARGSILDSSQIGLRKRHNRLTQSSVVSDNGCMKDIKQDDEIKERRRLSDIWEGWTMTARGNVKFYEIPDGEDTGLLIKKLGPVRKFGHKSIVVCFGNIMKVLYLGNDNLIEEDECDAETASPYQNTNSLSFINRRRKLRMKKYDLTHSTNFEDSTKCQPCNV